MKRRFILLLGLLVILTGVIGPALFLDKVTPPDQREQQKESLAISTPEPDSTANQQSAAAETNQSGQVPEREKAVPANSVVPANNAAPESTAVVRAAAETATALVPEKGCAVEIAVIGKSGELLFKPGQVVVKKENKWGITVLGALDTTGIPYTTLPTWPDFVGSICGQANHGVSGWMYSVNGDTPMHMADKHPVKTGDKVVWWYSNSMDQPQPQWEELIQQN